MKQEIVRRKLSKPVMEKLDYSDVIIEEALRIAKEDYGNQPSQAIKTFLPQTVDTNHIFYVSEGERYVVMDVNGNIQDVQTITNDTVGAVDVEHGINAKFTLPDDVYMIFIGYHKKYFMKIYTVEKAKLRSDYAVDLTKSRSATLPDVLKSTGKSVIPSLERTPAKLPLRKNPEAKHPIPAKKNLKKDSPDGVNLFHGEVIIVGIGENEDKEIKATYKIGGRKWIILSGGWDSDLVESTGNMKEILGMYNTQFLRIDGTWKNNKEENGWRIKEEWLQKIQNL